jgi:hypothetical protein
MFTTHHIATGFAAALMLTVIGSAPATAMSSAVPIAYLEYDLTPYFNSMTGSESAFLYWRPNSGLESSYRGLFDYAPGEVARASPMIGYVPYLGYDLTRFYNLAPGCPLNNGPIPIC